ncbi:MAG: hypothetical protein ACKVOM_00060 [Ferruginibacter sp.]
MPKFYALLITFLFMNSAALIAQNKRIPASLENKVLTAAKGTNLVNYKLKWEFRFWFYASQKESSDMVYDMEQVKNSIEKNKKTTCFAIYMKQAPTTSKLGASGFLHFTSGG